jgi:hypothetical protein
MHSVYRIDVSRGLVVLYWSEFPTIERLKEVVLEVVADSEFRTGMNFLWDRKPGLTNPASATYLRDAFSFLKILAEQIGPHSWAIVGHNEADFGKARVLEAKSDGTKVTIRAFRSAGDAEEWLRDPVPYEPFVVHFPARGVSSMYPDLGV